MEPKLISLFAAVAVAIPGMVLARVIYNFDKKKGLIAPLKKELN